MAELKTRPTGASVDRFLAGIADPNQRADAEALRRLMEKITDEPARMWGDSTVGFGSRHLKYASGREIDWFEVGFSPRKQNLTLYVTADISQYADLLGRLGPHSTAKGCLYIKRLAEVNQKVLRQLIKAASTV